MCRLSIASAWVSLYACGASAVISWAVLSWVCSAVCGLRPASSVMYSGSPMLSLDDALRVRALFISLGSVSAVAREFGCDVKTVRRVLASDYSLPPRRCRVVDIDSWLADLITATASHYNLNHKNRLTPARAFELLQTVGYRGSLRTVERRFKVVSERLGAAVERPASLCLTACPGSFQVDFGLMDLSFRRLRFVSPRSSARRHTRTAARRSCAVPRMRLICFGVSMPASFSLAACRLSCASIIYRPPLPRPVVVTNARRMLSPASRLSTASILSSATRRAGGKKGTWKTRSNICASASLCRLSPSDPSMS